MTRQFQGGGEAETARLLRQASEDYWELPDAVAHRLDRVLETLPAADTLRSAAEPAPSEGFLERWAERLRPKRVRYAILSGAAAVLVTVGAVAVGVQVLQPQMAGEDAASEQADAGGQPEAAPGDSGAASPEGADETAAEEGEEFGADDEGDRGVGVTGVEAFSSGTDYTADTDLLAALRGLGGSSTADAPVPAELADLAAGGAFWHACEDAIAETYSSLLLAVDFARYESQPAVVALLLSEDSEIAVALTPACGDGVIEVLAIQP